MEKLEKELYSGALITKMNSKNYEDELENYEDELEKKAEELKVKINITDFKNKVSNSDSILIGEVSPFEDGVMKKRKLYASAGN